MSLSATIKSLQDIMRKDDGVDGDAQRISQLVWLLFLKVFDAYEEELELTRDSYRSPLPKHLRWRTWAADPEGLTGDGLADFVNNTLFPKLKALPGSEPRAALIRAAFEDAYNYMKSGTLLRQVINKLNADIDFNSSAHRHLFGDIYEQFLRDLQSAGNAGEYYTPRAVTQFMVEMTRPRLGDIVLDPACGTGGFLTCALEFIRKHEVKTPADEQRLQESIRGVEKKHLPHMLCSTNLLLHGVEVPVNIRHDNTLARPYASYTSADRVDVILTNPPFGGMEEDGTENNFPATFRTKETADLFLALIIHLLRDGGRAALVLPDGTLFGEGVKTRLKQELLEKCNLHTIVRLPNGVFAPYTSIKTNLLFFTKGEKTKEIWYYEHPYPAGVKSYNKTKPIALAEFEPERKWWKKRTETPQAWRVPLADIEARGYNLDIKNPHTVDAAHRAPAELLAEYQAAQSAAAEIREKLRKELETALRR
ncbi:MAG: class I SAM-dependent DNA methyltransferase [Opitutaceae bacterium]